MFSISTDAILQQLLSHKNIPLRLMYENSRWNPYNII